MCGHIHVWFVINLKTKDMKKLFIGLMAVLALIGAVVWYYSFICNIWALEVESLMLCSYVLAGLYPLVWIISVKDNKGVFLDDLMALWLLVGLPISLFGLIEWICLPPYVDLWPTWQLFALSFISLIAFPLLSALRIGISVKKA